MSFQFLSESEPVARKPYRCLWCPEPIPVGLRHYAYAGRFDGEFQSSRMHLECRDAMRALHRIDRFAVEDGIEPHFFARGTTNEKSCSSPSHPERVSE